MAVLPFRTFAEARQSKPRDWSQNEIGEFLRAHNLLSQNGVSIGIDRGLSDVGEPWLVFYDTQSHDVFLHVARISNRCVLVCEPLELHLWSADLSSLILRFEEAVTGLVKERAENNKVVLHPAARMIMAVSAVFLLFKLDGTSNVYAKDDLHLGGDVAARKYESSVMMRVQSAMARMLEVAESPAAMAAVVSVLVANEILGNMRDSGEADTQAPLAELPAEAALVPVDQLATQDGAPLHTDAEIAALVDEAAAMAADAVTPSAALLAARLLEAAAHLLDDAPAVDVASYAPWSEATAAHPPAAPAPETTVAEAAPAAEPLPADTAVAAATAVPPPTVVATQSASAVQQLFNIDWTKAEVIQVASADLLEAPLADTGDVVSSQVIAPLPVHQPYFPPVALPNLPLALNLPEPVSAPVVNDISLGSLWALESQVGFFSQQEASGSQLGAALRYFAEAFGVMEIEYSGDYILFEQAGLAGSHADELGIWRHSFDDGSSITVIGQVDIVDDVLLLA